MEDFQALSFGYRTFEPTEGVGMAAYEIAILVVYGLGGLTCFRKLIYPIAVGISTDRDGMPDLGVGAVLALLVSAFWPVWVPVWALERTGILQKIPAIPPSERLRLKNLAAQRQEERRIESEQQRKARLAEIERQTGLPREPE